MPTAIRRADTSSVRERAVIKAWLAPSLSPRPMRMATTVAPPMGKRAVTATAVVMNGTAMLTAPRAAEPTPRPTKMPSTTL